ncbi:hypothetical protein HMPREF1992_00823 [Selenomonas sp. oral taxon 892 str. F0426]|nr:hypothetical protein HMPREF1992_00823 [Selenomonas sp. oral taxon 892 str. F0426]
MQASPAAAGEEDHAQHGGRGASDAWNLPMMPKKRPIASLCSALFPF